MFSGSSPGSRSGLGKTGSFKGDLPSAVVTFPFQRVDSVCCVCQLLFFSFVVCPCQLIVSHECREKVDF